MLLLRFSGTTLFGIVDMQLLSVLFLFVGNILQVGKRDLSILEIRLHIGRTL